MCNGEEREETGAVNASRVQMMKRVIKKKNTNLGTGPSRSLSKDIETKVQEMGSSFCSRR